MSGTRRFLLICLGVLLPAVPMVYFSLSYLRATTTYAGDQVEGRNCRWCTGDGLANEETRKYGTAGNRCPACGGSGSVDVLIPGPLHPTRVAGQVLDAALVHPGSACQRSKSAGFFQEVFGAIEGAQVVFTNSSGEVVKLVTTSQGKFTALLPPGIYQTLITAPGYKSYSKQLKIERLTRPQWLEKVSDVRS